MYETNAFMSGQTTLETNIMNDMNNNNKKKKFGHTIICSIVNKRVMEINIHSSKFRKG